MAPDLNKNGTKGGFKILLLRGFELGIAHTKAKERTS
jgi:hypothetical protein